MLELTRKTDYAIRSIVHLARLREKARLREIADEVGVPLTFLAKIFQQFTKAGLAKSFRGAEGGVVLGRPPEEITLLHVVEAVEGPITLNHCVADAAACVRSDRCRTHVVWRRVQRKLRESLGAITVSQMASGRQD